MIRLKNSIPLRFPRKANVPCSILFPYGESNKASDFALKAP
jgi:hypothetical protein